MLYEYEHNTTVASKNIYCAEGEGRQYSNQKV